jgi:antitoxin HicB
VRTSLPSKTIARVLICFHAGVLVGLHAFIKKSQKTPDEDLKIARKRLRRLKMANKHLGSTLDDLLKEEGVLEEFQATAIKEVIAWQLEQAMKDQNISKRKLASLMHTSRSQVDRVLDPTDGNVTLETLQRAAAMVGRKVQLGLI